MALSTSALVTWVGLADGLDDRYSAAAPVTCGVAIEVPVMFAVPPVLEVEVTFTAGPRMSTHLP